MSSNFDDFDGPTNEEPDFGGSGDDGFSAGTSAGAEQNGESATAGAQADHEDAQQTRDQAQPDAEHVDAGPIPVEPLGIDGPHADFVDVESKVMDETSLQAIMAALRADTDRSAENGDLIFKLGPMEALCKQFNEIIKNESQMPGVIEAFQHHMLAAFHVAAKHEDAGLYDTDGTPINPKTVKGLKARADTLDRARNQFLSSTADLVNDLNDAGYPADELIGTIKSNMDTRHKQMLTMCESTTTKMTVGEALLMKTQDVLAKAFRNGDLAGDARKYNNQALNEKLIQLKHVSTEIRFNAGKPEWERGDGKAAKRMAASLFDDLSGITEGRETKLNNRVLKKHLDEVVTNLTEAGSLTNDSEFQDDLRRMVQRINELVERITNTIRAAFSRFDSPRPA